MRSFDGLLRGALTLLLAVFAVACNGDDPEVVEEEAPAAEETTDLELVSEGRLTVCLDVPVEPFVVEDPDTQTGVGGFEIDVLEEVAERLDLQLEIEPARVERIQSGAVLGAERCDLGGSGLAMTEERAQRVDFTRPYFQARQAVLVAEDDGEAGDDEEADEAAEADDAGGGDGFSGDVEHLEEVEELGDLERLDGARVGVQTDSRGHELAEQHLSDSEVVPYEQLGDLLPALLIGEVDAVVRDLVALAPAQAAVDGVQVAFTVPVGDPYGFAMRSGRTDGLGSAVDAELQAMVDDGTLARMIETAFELQ